MKPITFPIPPPEKGPAVADLQAALSLFYPEPLTAVNPLLKALRVEQQKNLYGPATKEIVRTFQKENGLEGTGAVAFLFGSYSTN